LLFNVHKNLAVANGGNRMTTGYNDNMAEQTSPQEQWLICPICHAANPAGTLHCKFLLGSFLFLVKPISAEALAVITKKTEKRRKFWRKVRILSVSIGAPLLLVVSQHFLYLQFTDLLFAPTLHLNSTSTPGNWSMYRMIWSGPVPPILRPAIHAAS